MKSKGIGYGTAFAIIVMALVILMGTYYIVRTYSSGIAALQNYAESLQKPQLEVTRFTASNNQITVTLANKGSGAVLINNVELYKEDVNGIPTGTIPASNLAGTVFVPIGGTVSFNFNVQDISNFIFWNKPIRILVETDKGLYSLSYPLMTGLIYVNIHLPTWLTSSGNLRNQFYSAIQLYVSMGGFSSIPISLTPALNAPCSSPIVSPPSAFFSYKICSLQSNSGDDVVVVLYAIAGVEYTLSVYGKPSVPLIQYPINWTQPQSSNDVPTFLFTSYAINYSSVVSVAPGSTSEVSFTIPDVFWQNGYTRPQPSQNQTSSPTVIDFSWLLDTTNNAYRSVGGNTENIYFQDYQKVLTIAGRLLYEGVITYTNPYGCPAYPLPVAPGQMHPEVNDSNVITLANNAYSETFTASGTSYSKPTGVPVILRLSSCSSTPSIGANVLEVQVKLTLNSGSYLVIPVTAYDDQGLSYILHQKSFAASIYEWITDPNGKTVAMDSVTSASAYTIYALTQFTPQLLVNANTAGVYTLRITVQLYQGSNLPKALAVYISKIIVIPISGSTSVCMYQAKSYPSFPWVMIDTSTGNMYQYSLANVITVYKPPTSNPGSYPQAITQITANNWQQLIGFYNGANTQSTFYNYASGVSVTSWPYLNTLSNYILIYGMINTTIGNNNRFQGAIGYIAEDIGYITNPSPNAYVANIMGRGYFYVVLAQYTLYSTQNTSDKRVQIEISIPSVPAGSYILVPYYFYGDLGYYRDPPQIQVTGGTTIAGVPPPSNITNSGNLLVVYVSNSGSTVNIIFTLPTPPLLSILSSGVNDWTYLGIGGIAVIKDPNSYANQLAPGTPTSNNFNDNYGIYLLKVTPVSPYTPVYISAYDLNGNLLASTSYSIASTTNLVLSIDAFTGAYNYDYWTYPYKQMYIVLSNAKCVMKSG